MCRYSPIHDVEERSATQHANMVKLHWSTNIEKIWDQRPTPNPMTDSNINSLDWLCLYGPIPIVEERSSGRYFLKRQLVVFMNRATEEKKGFFFLPPSPPIPNLICLCPYNAAWSPWVLLTCWSFSHPPRMQRPSVPSIFPSGSRSRSSNSQIQYALWWTPCPYPWIRRYALKLSKCSTW